jgi:hypothetical protein
MSCSVSQIFAAACVLVALISNSPLAASSNNVLAVAQAGGEDMSCRRYLPSIGKTVAVPCERASAPTPKEATAKLRAERLSLRAKIGRLPGDSPIPRGSLGVRISNLVPSLTKLIEPTNAKIFTNDVVPQSPAELAGLRPGDIILSIDGLEPNDSYGLTRIVQGKAPGSEVVLEIARVGQGGADLVQSLRDRADAGSMDAMTALGALMQFGVGSVKDEAEAAHWLRMAAERGNAEAMAGLGLLYESGRGVSKDDAEAVRWYRKGAEAGNPTAMKDLAVMYANGLGIATNEAEGVRWYRKGAEAGSVEAMGALAAMYEGGHGIARDPTTASQWMFKALQGGDEFSYQQMTTNSAAWGEDFRRELQRRFKESGIYDGPSDGDFGPSMQRALATLKQRGK